MDRLSSMKMLVAVVEAGSLSAASRRLKIPLATVSRRIAELEGHLGAKLLNRTSRSLDLTDAGRDYLAASRRILDDVAEAERAAAGEYAAPKGELIVPRRWCSAGCTCCLLSSISSGPIPDIDIRLVLNDRRGQPCRRSRRPRRQDRRIAGQQPRCPACRAISRIVCASPAYLAARGRPKTSARTRGP